LAFAMVLEAFPFSINFAIPKPIAKPTMAAIIIIVLSIVFVFIKKPTLEKFCTNSGKQV